MEQIRSVLEAELPALGLDLPADRVEKLAAFLEAVLRQNQVMNLTAVTDPAQGARRHLLDSLTVLSAVDLRQKTLIDVGCGAGFPGVPLAIACPESSITLLDSLGKRMHWLETSLPALGIDARCVTARAEEAVRTCRETYDYAASRAVARLNILLELTAPYVKVGGGVIAMKGSAAMEELEEASSAVKKLGLKLEKTVTHKIDGADHILLIFRKVAATPRCYPRKYAKIKQSPL